MVLKRSQLLPLSFLLLVLVACQNPSEKDQKAQEIIQKAIESHGGTHYEEAKIKFDFRDKQYSTMLDGGQYRYIRNYRDTSGNKVKEVMTNDSAYRLINGEKVNLSSKEEAILKGSLNSVNYFLLLPYHLNDDAVIPEYMGKDTIKDTTYHEIKVNFRKQGGGKDYQDTYMYWFQTDDYTMDYLAYRYQTNEGGIRFRDATEVMKRGGIIFQNYLNLAPPSKDITLNQVDNLFEDGQLEKVSRIDKENIRVENL